MPKTKTRSPAPLRRTQIASAGLKLLDADGLEGLSMRKLAQVLCVEAMSLYNHIKNKDDLLAEIVNLVVAKVPLPDPRRSWRERIEALILGLYATLTRHPHILPILAREQAVISSPRALAVMEAAARALAESGLSPSRQVSAFRGSIALCFGFVLTHTRGLTATRAQADAVWNAWDSSQWDAAGVPHLAALAPEFLKTKAGDDLAQTLSAFLESLSRDARLGE
jgi:TetR/AcrR family transcriptional regulator, tetracycline repressor protein